MFVLFGNDSPPQDALTYGSIILAGFALILNLFQAWNRRKSDEGAAELKIKEVATTAEASRLVLRDKLEFDSKMKVLELQATICEQDRKVMGTRIDALEDKIETCEEKHKEMATKHEQLTQIMLKKLSEHAPSADCAAKHNEIVQLILKRKEEMETPKNS